MSNFIPPNNQQEIDKFNSLANSWWDINGSFKTLHHINQSRIEFINKFINLKNNKVLDVGCGGGILSEGLSLSGAIVTGLDMAPDSISIAQKHAAQNNLVIDYYCAEISDFISTNTISFDSIVCMEMLEHVNDVDYIICNLAKLISSGKYMFLSTINRNWLSYVGGVVAAEYVLDLIPKGTHDYAKFIVPHELRIILAKHGFDVVGISGLTYNPFTMKANLSSNVKINYLLAAVKI